MEVPYIFAILNTLLGGVYVYIHQAFNFTDRAAGYLSSLSVDPEKLSNAPKVLDVLRNRDLPNTKLFSAQRNRFKSLLAVTIIVNLVNYVLYPYDNLLYWWMQYILIGACAIANFDSLRIFLTVRFNRQMIDSTCMAYSELVRAHEDDKMIEKTVISLNVAFEEMMEDLNKAFIEDNNKNEDDEK